MNSRSSFAKVKYHVQNHGAGWQVFEGGGKLVEQDKGYHPDKWHLPNFIDCIRSRRQPNGGIGQAHLNACVEHLATIAYRTDNRKLLFDGKTERFLDNNEANKHLRAEYRKQYRVPEEV